MNSQIVPAEADQDISHQVKQLDRNYDPSEMDLVVLLGRSVGVEIRLDLSQSKLQKKYIFHLEHSAIQLFLV